MSFWDGVEDDDLVKYSEIVVGVMFSYFRQPVADFEKQNVLKVCGLEKLCINFFAFVRRPAALWSATDNEQ